jgi:hypothetical protein
MKAYYGGPLWALSQHVCNVYFCKLCCITIRKCDPNHYVIQSFFNGLHQFHYNDIWPNVMEWASDQSHMAMTNGTLVDWSNDTI